MTQPDRSETVYDGGHIKVTLERWGDRVREIVEHPGSVVVLAVDGDRQVTFVRQLREAARGELLELPAGTIDPGEEPLATARRELAEETGLTGGDWREVTAFYTSPGICRERMTVFFAEGVESGEANPQKDEQFALTRVPVAELEGLLAEVEDAKTLVALLLYLRTRR